MEADVSNEFQYYNMSNMLSKASSKQENQQPYRRYRRWDRWWTRIYTSHFLVSYKRSVLPHAVYRPYSTHLFRILVDINQNHET